MGRKLTMRALLLTLAALAALATSASAAMPVGGATAAATPQSAGVKPARLKVSLTLELQCAKPGPTPIVVSLPRAWRVPKTVAGTAVLIDNVHPKNVDVSNHTLTIQPVVPKGTCTVLAPGTIKLRFTRAAKLGNPRRAGRYRVRASIGTQDFAARVTITPAS
jgi:hypothetical protein